MSSIPIEKMASGLTAALSLTNVFKLVGLWVAYRLVLVLYNVSPWHPLYRFPGPKIAAASYLYEAYYDWWLTGRYGNEIRRMHEQYGTWPSPGQALLAPKS